MRRSIPGWAIPTAALLAGVPAGLRWPPPKLVVLNESSSLPKGVYLRARSAQLGRGSVVLLRQPVAAQSYLAGLGLPPQVGLIKRVAAIGGDAACAAPDGVRLPSGWLPTHSRDRLGVKLPTWRGCRRLRPDEVFVVGDSVTSFDSRYFGPVRVTDLEGVYRQVRRW